MGKHFALTFQLPNFRQQQQQARRKNQNILSGVRAQWLGMSILVLLVGAMLLYLVQVNNFATKGYEIKKLQTAVSQLQDENSKLVVQAAQLQSIQRIQTDPAVLNMVPATQMTYVQTTSLTEK